MTYHNSYRCVGRATIRLASGRDWEGENRRRGAQGSSASYTLTALQVRQEPVEERSPGAWARLNLQLGMSATDCGAAGCRAATPEHHGSGVDTEHKQTNGRAVVFNEFALRQLIVIFFLQNAAILKCVVIWTEALGILQIRFPFPRCLACKTYPCRSENK